jgi:glycosyltransferase involved in cell wall biosynthesis
LKVNFGVSTKAFMKILFYSHSSTAYGATSSLVDIIKGICCLEPTYNLHVVLPESGPIVNELESAKIGYTIIPHYNWFYNYELSENKKASNILFWKLWMLKNKYEKRFLNKIYLNPHNSLVSKFQPDIIYVNSSLAPTGLHVAIKHNIPYIWHHRETINEPAYGFYLYSLKLFKKYFKRATLHIYPSYFLRDYYKKYGYSENVVVYNGVKEGKYKREKHLQSSLYSFGIVGRINTQKGQEAVINTFKKLNQENLNFPLHVIGGGDKVLLEKLNSSITNEPIKFHGFLDREIIFDHFDFLIVNATNEAFGRVLAEANSYGIPVLAINSGALPELVKPGVNGFIYNNTDDLYSIIKDKISNLSPEEYAVLSKSSREEYISNYTTEKLAKNILMQIKSMSISNNSQG